MPVPLSGCLLESFVAEAGTEDAAVVAFEISHFASEALVNLWHKCRRIVAAGETPSDFLLMAIEQQAQRVVYARQRYQGKQRREAANV